MSSENRVRSGSRRRNVRGFGGLGAVVMGVVLLGLGAASMTAVAQPAGPAGGGSGQPESAARAGKKFTLFIYETPEQFALRGDRSPAGGAYWASFAAYGKSLQEAGVLRGGSPLEHESAVRVVRMRDGKRTASEGVHATPAGGQTMGGYFIIEVPTLEDALDWAARAPNATTGAVEVRPVLDVPGM